MPTFGVDPLILSTIVALGIGLLIGIERERSKGSGPEREVAGVRTFTLVSALGLLSAVAESPVALGVFGVAVTAIALAGYLKTRQTDPGVTTEVALVATFALGALSLAHPAYSAGIAVVLTILLASRTWLHEAIRTRLTGRELQDALLLLAAVLVILPLLPDRTFDPFQAINPRRLWYVVVLVMGLNATAYIALRLLGPRKGLLLAGMLGGFVSSISTHGAMGQRASAQPSLAMEAAAAANVSSVATAALLFIVLSAVHFKLAMQILPAALAAGTVSAAMTASLMWKGGVADATELPLGHPLSVRAALTFGLILAAVLFTSALLTHWLGPRGALLSIAAAGFADTHSAAISAGLMSQQGALSAQLAQVAVLAAFTTNALVKVIVSWASGPRVFAWLVTLGVALSVGAAWLAWWSWS